MTEDGETKMGAGLCNTHASKTKCTATELPKIVARLFGVAGLSCVNISFVNN